MEAPDDEQLRLGRLLHELGARPPADPPITDVPDTRPVDLTVGDLVDKAAEAGFGFLIGILTLIAIPFFGLSTPFGLAIALLAAQMTVGRGKPWLPARARRRKLSMAMLDKVAGLLARRTRWLARSTRPRWGVLVRPTLIGFATVLLALGLALPLPIPGSNLVFLVPIFIYAIGLLERDGVWIAIGHACLIIDIVLLFIFGNVVWHVVAKLVHWIVG